MSTIMEANSGQDVLPRELDSYMQESIFHSLGLCSSEHHLHDQLLKAEESYQDLALQMEHMQRRLREIEYKSVKSKEEAVLSAQALKRQVADSQRLAEQHRALKKECSRLEQECDLYHNDRDIFEDAACEAEDRAAEAEDRAMELERMNEALIDELERLRQTIAQDGRVTLEMDYTEYVASLKLRIVELEEENSRLQDEVWALRSEGHPVMSAFEARLQPEEAKLQALLLEAKEKYDEKTRELRSLQEKYDQEVASKRAELEVHAMVSSAITTGICKALEEDKDDSLNAQSLEFSSIFLHMESELGGTRERVKVAESDVQALRQETQALRQEAELCRGNLDKAEVENKGGGQSQSGGRPRSKAYDGLGEESICVLCNARQPLMPLSSNSANSANSAERKVNRRQNLTVDGNFRSRSPRSPSLEISPGSIFQD